MPKYFVEAALNLTVEIYIDADSEKEAEQKAEAMSAEDLVENGTVTECEYEDVWADELDDDEEDDSPEDDEDLEGDSDEMDADDDAGPLGEGEQR